LIFRDLPIVILQKYIEVYYVNAFVGKKLVTFKMKNPAGMAGLKGAKI